MAGEETEAYSWYPVEGLRQWGNQVLSPNESRLCLGEYLYVKEIRWAHPLIPLGTFHLFPFLFVCLPVLVKDGNQSPENPFTRMESTVIGFTFLLK